MTLNILLFVDYCIAFGHKVLNDDGIMLRINETGKI